MKSWVFGTWNEIGAKNEHFNFATLSDKQIVSFYHAKSLILPKNIQLQTQNKMQKIKWKRWLQEYSLKSPTLKS